jgi:hypothetical protein
VVSQTKIEIVYKKLNTCPTVVHFRTPDGALVVRNFIQSLSQFVKPPSDTLLRYSLQRFVLFYFVFKVIDIIGANFGVYRYN